MRRPAPRVKPRIARSKSWPAPTGGWIANQNLATPDTRAAQGAFVLDNWFPLATGARMRSGSQKYATIGDSSADVVAMFSYVNGNNRALFGTTADAIYDVTTIADADVSPTAAVDTLGSGAWVSEQFATTGGVFLRLVNGVDTPLIYDGTDFVTSPALTGDADPEDFSYVWAFQKRLFFVEKESLNAWYLPVDSIGGECVILPLGGIFSKGGSLLFGASWSLDTGAGLSEQCIFVTTEGEVAVFQGNNPGDADNWQKVGVYKIGRPLGRLAHMRAGGDIIIATDIGYVPLSMAINRDVAALSPAAVSYPIETAWNEAVAARAFAEWHCAIWPTAQAVMVSMPSNTENQPQIFVANARTGAWARYTGWDATCLSVFGDRAFFGSKLGVIMEAEVSGYDGDAPYTATYVPLFEDMRSPASMKTLGLGRCVYLAPTELQTRLSGQFDFDLDLPTSPDATPTVDSDLWGSGVWGSSSWGQDVEKSTFEEWVSVGGRGSAVTVALQITSGALAPPAVDLVRIDMTYDVADIVT